MATVAGPPHPVDTQAALAALRVEFATLLDTQAPLVSRLRELYAFKDRHVKTPAGALLLLEAVDTTDSVLLQHEFAYNVGQSGCRETCPGLEAIVRDADHRYSIVTRHEAVEALGAIGDPSSRPLLEFYRDPCNEPEAPIRESCELALERLRFVESHGVAAAQPPVGCAYVSIDPSPAFSPAALAAVVDRYLAERGDRAAMRAEDAVAVAALEDILLAGNGGAAPASLWERYRAMFSLRNMATELAVRSLCKALDEDHTSALFRHEIAFVLGQMEHPASESALMHRLVDEAEAPMVRHEAAEALGAILGNTVQDAAGASELPPSDLLQLLERYENHPEGIVRDSCAVALEMYRYWSGFANQFKQPQETI